VALLAAYWALLRIQTADRHQKQRLEKFEQRLNTATAGAIGMGQRILVLEEKLQSLHDAAAHTPDSDSAAYTQAMQLFDCGADINTVMASCGISSSEASLMALMRQKTHQKAGASPLNAAEA